MLDQELMQSIVKKLWLDYQHSEVETLALEAMAFNSSYQEAILKEIAQLRTIIDSSKEKEFHLSYENLKREIFDRMEQDLALIKKISEVIRQNPQKYNYVLTTNKIEKSIIHTRNFLEQNFDNLYDGVDIPGYNLGKADDVNAIGYTEESAWGSVKIVTLQVSLLYMAAALTNKRLFKDIELGLYQDTPHFADQSAICHIEPLAPLSSNNPSSLEEEVQKIRAVENIENFSWLFSDEITELGLLNVPGGYSFGGGRGSARHPRNYYLSPSKERPTHDCSSYFADIADVPHIVSTMQQHEAWRKSTILQQNGVWDHDTMSNYGRSSVSSKNLTQKEVEEYNKSVDYLVSSFPAINLTDPQNQLDSNSIYIKRVFKPQDNNLLDGSAGGHTAFLAGISNDGKAVVIETNRNIDSEKVQDTYIGYGSMVRPLCEDANAIGNTPVIHFAKGSFPYQKYAGITVG